MNAQAKALTPPIIREAEHNQLKLSALSKEATAQIFLSQPGSAVGDMLNLVTKMGKETHEVSAQIQKVPQILELKIPKAFFEKNLISSATANIYYTITHPTNTPVHSPELVLTVVE